MRTKVHHESPEVKLSCEFFLFNLELDWQEPLNQWDSAEGKIEVFEGIPSHPNIQQRQRRSGPGLMVLHPATYNN